MLRESSDRLADTIDSASGGLIEELKSVRDAVEELYLLLDHVVRNREELYDILAAITEKKAEESGEATSCIHCNAFCPTVAEAVKAGWVSLQHNPSEDWDYLGICANCQKDVVEQELLAKSEQREELEDTGRAMGLTLEEIEQAKAEGVTSALGLRRIEKNGRPREVPEITASVHGEGDTCASDKQARLFE
jgi:hypothetical protein